MRQVVRSERSPSVQSQHAAARRTVTAPLSRARPAAAAPVARPLCGKRANDRLVGALQPLDGALQLAAVGGMGEDLPGPEDAPTQIQGCPAQLPLCSEALCVRLSVAR